MTEGVAERGSTRLPPKAPGVVYFGNSFAYMRDPLAFLCETRDRYGDVVRVALGPLKVVLVSHPDLVEDILVTRSRLFKKDAFMQVLNPVLGQGLLTSEGEFWRKQRRLAQPAFHRARIEGYGQAMSARAQKLADTWRHGEERDIHADMMRLTLEIVADALFGADVGGHAEAVGEAIEAVLAVVSDPLRVFLPKIAKLPLPSQRRFERAVSDLDRIVYGVIDARRRESDLSTAPERTDLLAMLLAVRDEDGSRMSDKQLRDECMTLFLAGHETTAIHLMWTFLLLSQHPAVEERVVEEIDRVLEGRPAGVADVAKLELVKNVLAESMRLYPPAWSMGREALEDLTLGGFQIRRGEQIWFCPWSIQRDRRFYDAPDAFWPHRWDDPKIKSLPRYAYFPFGGGARLCIGQAFAQIEAAILLATLLQRFRVEVLPRPRPAPAPSVTLRPKKGLHARVRRRPGVGGRS